MSCAAGNWLGGARLRGVLFAEGALAGLMSNGCMVLVWACYSTNGVGIDVESAGVDLVLAVALLAIAAVLGAWFLLDLACWAETPAAMELRGALGWFVTISGLPTFALGVFAWPIGLLSVGVLSWNVLVAKACFRAEEESTGLGA